MPRKESIQSETEFLLKFIIGILLTPITLIRVLMKKERAYSLLEPFERLVRFITEPRFTFSIIFITLITSTLAAIFFSGDYLYLFLVFPSDLLEPQRWFSFITSGFIHSSWAHLAGNMFILFIFGRVVERKLGSMKTALIYFVAMIISSVGYATFYLIAGNMTPALGASGAIMGLVAAAILLNPLYITYELIIPLPVMLVGWLTLYADLMGVLNPANTMIGHFAHLLGFFSITVSLFFLERKDRSELNRGMIINSIILLMFVVVAAGFMIYG